MCNLGCWGKHAHIPDNDYWGICLFYVVWTNFFVAIILMWYTRNIYIFSSTEHCAWAIISPREFKSCVTCISFALLYWKTELSAVKYFAICTMGNLTCSLHATYLHTIYVKSPKIHILLLHVYKSLLLLISNRSHNSGLEQFHYQIIFFLFKSYLFIFSPSILCTVYY
jgi:hypothetical protein